MAGPNWKNWKLLIVDADKEFLNHATAVLKKVGMGEVRSTDSPQTAMELLDGYAADAALIGIQLKGISGVEYVSRLRNPRTSPKPSLPIILVISAADPKSLLNACRVGIENFIRKPIEDDVLCRRVSSTIQNPRRFVVTREYFGPERRRRNVPVEIERRRGAKATAGRPVRRASGNRENIPLVDAPQPPVPSTPAPKAAPPPPSAATKPVPRTDVPLVDAPPPTANKPATGEDWQAALDPQVDKEKSEVEDVGVQLDQKILGKHIAWLRSGGKEGKRASFANEDLHGVDLQGLVLSNASFNGADLSDANCEGAELSSADLRRAILSNANIKGGKLGVAQMRHSVLDRAILEGAILRGADLAGANLEGANLKEADFSGAILLSTNLRGADLSGATGLTQAQLDRCMGDLETILPAGLRISNPDG